MEPIRPPAANPCGSCPYRRDVPSGVWSEGEYEKLPPYDNAEMSEQPMGVFMCHQQDGRMCAGWTGCHNMEDNMAVRMAVVTERLTGDDIDAVLDYQTPVPLWGSGQEARDHGMAELHAPSPKARRTIDNLVRKGVAEC